MRTEVRITDRDGSPLPDDALSSAGTLYAEVARMQRLRNLAYRLAERVEGYFQSSPAYLYRLALATRAEERCCEAWDRYEERCRGIEVCTVTYYSAQAEEGYPSITTI